MDDCSKLHCVSGIYVFLVIEPKTSHPTIGGFLLGRCLAPVVFKGHVQCFFAISVVQPVNGLFAVHDVGFLHHLLMGGYDVV